MQISNFNGLLWLQRFLLWFWKCILNEVAVLMIEYGTNYYKHHSPLLILCFIIWLSYPQLWISKRYMDIKYCVITRIQWEYKGSARSQGKYLNLYSNYEICEWIVWFVLRYVKIGEDTQKHSGLSWAAAYSAIHCIKLFWLDFLHIVFSFGLYTFW